MLVKYGVGIHTKETLNAVLKWINNVGISMKHIISDTARKFCKE